MDRKPAFHALSPDLLLKASRGAVEAAASGAITASSIASHSAAAAGDAKSQARRQLNATVAAEAAAALENAAARKRLQERRAAPSVATRPGPLHSSVPGTSRTARSDCTSPASMEGMQCSARRGHITLDSIDPGVLTACGAALTAGPLASVVGIDEGGTRKSPLPRAGDHPAYRMRSRSPAPAATARAPGAALPPVTRVRRASAPTPTEPPPLAQRPRRGTADTPGHLMHGSPPVSLAAGGQPRRTRCAQGRRGPLIYDLSTDADRVRAATRIAAVVRGWLVRRRARVTQRRERLDLVAVGVGVAAAVGISALLTGVLPPLRGDLVEHHLPLLSDSNGARAEGPPLAAAATPGRAFVIQAAGHCAASAVSALLPLLHTSPSATSSGGLPALSPTPAALAAVSTPQAAPVQGTGAAATSCSAASLGSSPAGTFKPVPPLSSHRDDTAVKSCAALENPSLVPPPDGMPPAAFAALLAFVREKKTHRRMATQGVI